MYHSDSSSGLNPVHAGIVLTPETSDFTSVLERIVDRQSAVDIEDTSQAPSSGLAATFSPGAGRRGGGEGAGGAMQWIVALNMVCAGVGEAPVALDSPREKVREKVRKKVRKKVREKQSSR
ncbi:MAG: hypothetical protein NTX48_05235 [Planctomycetales bacterium]|nr:hypothetical protein [Planctomycetales bacterium]